MIIKNHIMVVVIVFFCAVAGMTGAAVADWQQTLEQNFDIVETFDQLQDWRGVNGLRGYDHNKENMPKKLDGSPSIWDMYDDWSLGDPKVDWIRHHGEDNVWCNTGKSLRISLMPDPENEGKTGPSRFGLYFGSDTPGVADAYATNGLPNSGYNEAYFFYMVKIPNNMFPTDNGGLWPDDTYKWWGYHKFATFCTSFSAINLPGGAATPEGNGCRWEYGCSNYLLQLMPCGSRCTQQYQNTFTQSGNLNVFDIEGNYNTKLYEVQGLKSGAAEDFLNQQVVAGKWIGLEVRVSRGTSGNFDGQVDVWAYTEDGVELVIYSNDELIFQSVDNDWAFNKFFFGGNIKYNADIEPQNLDVTYYVDDFLIDDQRIGPRYFALLNENNPPSVPVDLRIQKE